jgi:hypothetical protein
MKTKWNDQRLQSLFDRYNRLYFCGTLSNYQVKIATLDEALGRCDRSKRIITINVDDHPNDRQLRGTVLHEMAHAAARKPGHGVHFFAQVERLLQRRAPIAVDEAEGGGLVRILANLVPARFPLLKQKMDTLEARRQKRFHAIIKAKDLPVYQITDGEILTRFEDAALWLTWKHALVCVGVEYGLTDECGRPLSAYARRMLVKARRVFYRTRRVYLECEKAQKNGVDHVKEYVNTVPVEHQQSAFRGLEHGVEQWRVNKAALALVVMGRIYVLPTTCVYCILGA